jgi:hypothetical protein
MNLGQRRSPALTVTISKRHACSLAAAGRLGDRRARLRRLDRRDVEAGSGARRKATCPGLIEIAQGAILQGK